MTLAQRIDHPRSAPIVVVAASDTAAYLQRAADYVCDGTADDVEIQAAIDLAQTFVTASGACDVVFLPGRYHLATGLTKKSANLIGAVPNSGVRIIWDGSAGGTMVTQSALSTGSCSFGLIEGIEFLPGTAEPATILDLTADSVDVLYRLRELHFGGSSGDSIKVASWINCHWEHLRFDGCGGYAVSLTPGSSQNLSTFHLSDFTFDHHRLSSPGKGVFLIDNSAGATNIGKVMIEHGRVEVNSAWDTIANGATRAVVTIKGGAGLPARSVGLHLSDLTYSDATGMSDDSLLYRNTSNTTGSETFQFRNIGAANLSTLFGGTWSAAFPLLSVPATGITELMCHGGVYTIFEAIDQYGAATDAANTSRISTDTVARFSRDVSGKMSYGPGSGAADVTTERSATNAYKVTASAGLLSTGPVAPQNTAAKDYAGAGTPEGNVVAAIGSTYRRTDGGAGTSFYVKESGAGNTGWVGK